MPEGDSLVRLAHRLRPVLAGRALTHADLRVPQHATADLTGWTVVEVEPRGKYLLMRLTPPAGRPAARPLTLVSHLKMEGRWLVSALDARWGAPAWQVRAVLETADHRVLGAQLGMLTLVPTDREDTVLGHLGPDLLDPAWDGSEEAAAALLAEGTRRLTARPERPVGLALLDQRTTCGIGNIYRCESLLLAGIDPHRPVGAVPDVPGLLTIARDLLRANVPRPPRSSAGRAPPRGCERTRTGPTGSRWLWRTAASRRGCPPPSGAGPPRTPRRTPEPTGRRPAPPSVGRPPGRPPTPGPRDAVVLGVRARPRPLPALRRARAPGGLRLRRGRRAAAVVVPDLPAVSRARTVAPAAARPTLNGARRRRAARRGPRPPGGPAWPTRSPTTPAAPSSR